MKTLKSVVHAARRAVLTAVKPEGMKTPVPGLFGYPDKQASGGPMLSRVAGFIAMVFGLLGIFYPRAFKNRLRRRMNFRVRLVVYGFIVVFAVLILGSVVTARGIPARAAGIAGLIISIKVIRSITSKSSERLSAWLEEKPLNFFRVWALMVLIMGIMLYLA